MHDAHLRWAEEAIEQKREHSQASQSHGISASSPHQKRYKQADGGPQLHKRRQKTEEPADAKWFTVATRWLSSVVPSDGLSDTHSCVTCAHSSESRAPWSCEQATSQVRSTSSMRQQTHTHTRRAEETKRKRNESACDDAGDAPRDAVGAGLTSVLVRQGGCP